MPGFLCKSAATALLAATSLMIAAPAAAAGVSVRTLAAQEARLATMAYRMATANANLCSRPEMMTGLILHDLTQYQPAKRVEVSRAFSLNSGIGVLQLVPGSAAARAGLRIDDEIIAVGGVRVENPSAIQTSLTSFGRMQGFADILQARLERGPTDLLIRRSGQVERVTMTAERGCGGQLSLSPSSGLNAWSDGRHIVLTMGMDQFAGDDDQIAFVIAHEMAHNILGHFTRPSKMGIFGSFRGRDRELDADGFAVRLMANSGYQPAAGIAFLEHSQRRLWWAFSFDHPGFGNRIRIVAAEIARWQPATLAYRQAVAVPSDSGRPALIPAVSPAPLVSAISTPAPAFAQSAQSWQQTLAWRSGRPVTSLP